MKDRIYLASPTMHGEEQKYIQEAFDTNWVAPLGKNVDEFEKEMAALFDGAQGAEIEFTDVKDVDKEKLALRYSEDNSDPINAAKCGYIDNIVQPSLIKQYLIASLQMLLK